MHTCQKRENIKSSIEHDFMFLEDSDNQLLFTCKWGNKYLRLIKLGTGPALDIYVRLKQGREDSTLEL